MPKDYITNEIFEREFSLVRSEAKNEAVFVRKEFELVRKEIQEESLSVRQEFALVRQEMREGFEQVNRNIGAMIEEFRDQVKVVFEGFQMEVEKVEMFRIENNDNHEKFNSRIARLEAKIINY